MERNSRGRRRLVNPTRSQPADNIFGAQRKRQTGRVASKLAPGFIIVEIQDKIKRFSFHVTRVTLAGPTQSTATDFAR